MSTDSFGEAELGSFWLEAPQLLRRTGNLSLWVRSQRTIAPPTKNIEETRACIGSWHLSITKLITDLGPPRAPPSSREMPRSVGRGISRAFSLLIVTLYVCQASARLFQGEGSIACRTWLTYQASITESLLPFQATSLSSTRGTVPLLAAPRSSSSASGPPSSF